MADEEFTQVRSQAKRRVFQTSLRKEQKHIHSPEKTINRKQKRAMN